MGYPQPVVLDGHFKMFSIEAYGDLGIPHLGKLGMIPRIQFP